MRCIRRAKTTAPPSPSCPLFQTPTTSSADGLPIFNLGSFLEWTDYDAQESTALIESFQEIRDSLVFDLRFALQQRNRQSIGSSAHRLFGSLKYVHADAPAQLMLDLDQQASEMEWEAITSAVEQLDRQVARLDLELSRVLKRFKSTMPSGENMSSQG